MRQIGVFLQLRLEDRHRGQGIGYGTVSTQMHFTAIIGERRGKVARLFLVINPLGIHNAPVVEIKLKAGACELLGQQGNIKAHDAEPAQVAVRQNFQDGGGHLPERRRVSHVGIGNMVDGRGSRPGWEFPGSPGMYAVRAGHPETA